MLGRPIIEVSRPLGRPCAAHEGPTISANFVSTTRRQDPEEAAESPASCVAGLVGGRVLFDRQLAGGRQVLARWHRLVPAHDSKLPCDLTAVVAARASLARRVCACLRRNRRYQTRLHKGKPLAAFSCKHTTDAVRLDHQQPKPRRRQTPGLYMAHLKAFRQKWLAAASGGLSVESPAQQPALAPSAPASASAASPPAPLLPKKRFLELGAAQQQQQQDGWAPISHVCRAPMVQRLAYLVLCCALVSCLQSTRGSPCFPEIAVVKRSNGPEQSPADVKQVAQALHRASPCTRSRRRSRSSRSSRTGPRVSPVEGNPRLDHMSSPAAKLPRLVPR